MVSVVLVIAAIRALPPPSFCIPFHQRCSKMRRIGPAAPLNSPALRAGIQCAPVLRIGGSPMTARIRPYALPGLRSAFPCDEAGPLLGAAGAAGVHAERDGSQRAAAQSACCLRANRAGRTEPRAAVLRQRHGA